MPAYFFQDILQNNKIKFNQYVSTYLKGELVLPLEVKVKHTQHVLEHALGMIASKACTEDTKLTVALAALYHSFSFTEARKQYTESIYLKGILKGLSKTPDIAEVWKSIHGILPKSTV